MDATCAIQASIHVFSLVRKYVSRILGTYQFSKGVFRVSKKKERVESLFSGIGDTFQIVRLT